MPARVYQLLPFVDPRELHSAPVRAVTDRRQDHSRLEPLERLLQLHVLALARTAADREQELVGRKSEEAGSPEAEISTSASQMVAMPCSGKPCTSTRIPPAS